MVTRVPKKDYDIILKFGGGLNTRTPADQVNERETVAGKNFALDLDDFDLRPRLPFDLAGTAPNAEPINGFAQLLDRDGKLTTLVQAGAEVYLWNGENSFTSVGTVNVGSRLRGPLSANTFDDVCLIYDLEKKTELLEWDGTTLSATIMSTGLQFFTKYAYVSHDRAIYANVISGTNVPSVIAVSAVSDHRDISIILGPGESRAEDDSFFLTAPDGRAINGILEAFGLTIFSSEAGRLFKLSGSNAQDFAIDALFSRSGAIGDEPIVFTGSDVLYGRAGRIESLVGTENFGDVELDDPSRQIFPDVKDVKSWDIDFDTLRKIAYCWPNDRELVYVFYSSVRDRSPWSLWKTDHPSAFVKTASMAMLDPTTGLDNVFWGDSAGRIFKMQGDGAGDGGTTDIVTQTTSKVFSAPLDALAYDVEGYIRYNPVANPVTFDISLLWGGTKVFETEASSIVVKKPTGVVHYSNGAYYSGSKHYGSSFGGKFVRERFTPRGSSEELQIKVEATTSSTFEINEIGLRFKASS